MKWIFIFAFGMASATMAQDMPWRYDFEERSGSYRADAGSEVSLSARRYKEGRQSLKFAWQDNGRLLFIDPAPGRNKALTGFRAWVYNEEALDEVLTFGFGTESELGANNPRYQFQFGLNFTGWRAMWINLREDARNRSYEGARNGRVTAFEIRASNSGAVYLDLVELVERIHPRRSPDAQVPFVNANRADRSREYRWSQNALPGPLPSQITDDERLAFDKIAARYEAWVLGDEVKDDQREPVRIRLNELKNYIRRGYRSLADYEIRREDDRILGKPLFAELSPYTPLFQSVFQGVLLRLVLDYRLNGNEKARDRALDVFDYLHDQGWAEGSGVGAMHHEFLRVAGYAHAVYLMRDILQSKGILERELATLKWFSMFGELYEDPQVLGANADFIRSVAMYRLLCILMMDDTPEKVANMRCYIAWLNNALSIAPGWLDTIKPDFVGFHHRGIYASGYAPNAFHVASVLVYLLHDTPFAVADDKRDNLKQALLTARVMANTYDISMAVNGRFPRNTAVATKLLPAYMYVALSYAPVDAELAGAFMQLWKPKSQLLIEDLFERVSVRLMYLHTPGAMQMMADFAEAGYAPAAPPSGHWTLPYGALSIHRRGDWMVSMKGWGKYVWDYESSGRNNPLGRYLSYGTMLIYASGDPVGREASGILRDGWDWSMWPGTTVIRLSHEQLKHEGRDRNFSDETFVGGVNMGGRNGVFALKLHDTRFNTSFRAVKTVFCFDDVIVCLGSGIENDDGGHATVTPLFQAAISEDRSYGGEWGKCAGDSLYMFSGTKGQTSVADGFSGEWVCDSRWGASLRVQRGVQVSKDYGRDSGGTGTFELAYLDHGSAPQDAIHMNMSCWFRGRRIGCVRLRVHRNTMCGGKMVRHILCITGG